MVRPEDQVLAEIARLTEEELTCPLCHGEYHGLPTRWCCGEWASEAEKAAYRKAQAWREPVTLPVLHWSDNPLAGARVMAMRDWAERLASADDLYAPAPSTLASSAAQQLRRAIYNECFLIVTDRTLRITTVI